MLHTKINRTTTIKSNIHPRSVGSICTFPPLDGLDVVVTVVSDFTVGGGGLTVNPAPYSSSNPAFDGSEGNDITIVRIAIAVAVMC